MELPENDYRVICFNYDTDGMVWKGSGSYTLFTADTRDEMCIRDREIEKKSLVFRDGKEISTDDLNLYYN